MTDYEQFLAENGLTEADCEREMGNVTFLPLREAERSRVRRGASSIHGAGIFAAEKMRPSDPPLIAMRGGVWTEVGRYTNHSPSPNCIVAIHGEDIVFSPLWIYEGDELTVNYRDVKKAITGGAALEPQLI